PGGRLIATAATDGTIRLHEARTGRPLGCLEPLTDGVPGLAFSPDESRLVDFGWRVRVWDVATGEQLHNLPGPTSGGVVAAALPADGAGLVSLEVDGQLRAWDLATGTESRQVKVGDAVAGAAFAPDGKLLAVEVDGDLLLWDVAAGKVRH